MQQTHFGLFGLILVSIISLLATWMDALSMQLSQALPWAEVHSISHLAMAVVCVCFVKLAKNGATLRTSCPKMMVFRSITALCALGFYYQALQTVSLTEFVTLNSLMPLLAGVLSTVMFQDKLSKWGWVAIFLGSGSVIFGYLVWDHELDIGLFFTLVGVVFSVITMQAARYIQLRENATISLVFYPALCTAIVPFVIAPEPLVAIEGSILPIFVAYIVLLISVRLLTTHTLRSLPVAGFGLFLNLQFVWAILIDTFYFEQTPSPYEFLIVLALILSVSLYIFKNKPPQVVLHGKTGSAATRA